MQKGKGKHNTIMIHFFFVDCKCNRLRTMYCLSDDCTWCDFIYTFWRPSGNKLFYIFAYLHHNACMVAQINSGWTVGIFLHMICDFVCRLLLVSMQFGKVTHGNGSLLASLAEAAFLTGLERNRCGLFGEHTCIYSSRSSRCCLCSSSDHMKGQLLFQSPWYCLLKVVWPLVDSLQWHYSDGQLCTAICKCQWPKVSIYSLMLSMVLVLLSI